MTSETLCQSCTMTIESGEYCQYCTDDTGQLKDFDEMVERMSQYTRRQNPELSREDAKEQTLVFMKERPAWRDHPRLKDHG